MAMRRPSIPRSPYRDPAKPVDSRVRDLLGQMTLEEKLRQTAFFVGENLVKKGRFSRDLAKRHLGDLGIGGVLDPRIPALATARVTNGIQKHCLERTRLGIPALIMCECLHGYLMPGATIFPQSIGLSSSWNPGLVRQVAAAAAREARAVGCRQAFSPDLDLARDPRWGRVEETYGEDTLLVTRLGTAYIEGLQGSRAMLGEEKLLATPKHFAGHCDPQGGINLGPADVGERKLREEYLPPFRAAVDAGVLSIMPAYTEIDGVPCSSSAFLMFQVLRDEWGFEGYTFSDFGAITMLNTFHGVAANLQEAGKMAFESGMDMEAPGQDCYAGKLLSLLKKGEISRERLDDAVGRILRAKFCAGLFEHPYVEEDHAIEIVRSDSHLRLARHAAVESMVLLKNEGDLLPLDRRRLSTIAVIGPNADVAESGDYCIPKPEDVSPLEGLRDAVSKATPIIYAAGCDLYAPDRSGFDAAVTTAEQAEVALLFVGGSSMSLGGIGWEIAGRKERPSTCGEGYDRTELGLPGVQQELVEAVVATGTPTVAVLINGRPLSIPWIDEHVPAILEAWYPGEQGGHAIADILFGRVNPSGKLTVSFPRSVGQVPKYYSQKPSGRGHYKNPGSPDIPGRDYVDSDPSPLYDFGFGLSYTTFRYSRLRVTPTRIGCDDSVKVSVDVRNTGHRTGKEVVQLYLNDVASSVTTPNKLLKDFKKITLQAGEKQTLEFELTSGDLSLLNVEMKRVVEPGIFEVTIGSLTKRFEVR